MGTIDFAASFLRDHGSWGLVAVLGLVVWRMALYIQEIQERHHDTVKGLLQDHNKDQKEETRELVEVMLSTKTALQAMNDTLNVLAKIRDR